MQKTFPPVLEITRLDLQCKLSYDQAKSLALLLKPREVDSALHACIDVLYLRRQHLYMWCKLQADAGNAGLLRESLNL